MEDLILQTERGTDVQDITLTVTVTPEGTDVSLVVVDNKHHESSVGSDQLIRRWGLLMGSIPGCRLAF